MSHPIVIVGSGLAGYTLARELRKLDKTTPLIVLSRDDAGFYSKPMLSNALAGGKTPASLVMRGAAQMAQELNADVCPRTTVLGIDREARTLRHTLPEGGERTVAYRDLVLALGADPVRLPMTGDAADRVRSVNDLDDFAAFLTEIEGAQRVAIIGAGLIGCEFANDLLSRGIEPVVIDPAPTPLGRLLPAEAGAYIQGKLQQAGVVLRHGLACGQVDVAGDRLQLTLSDGSLLVVDAVLSAVGLRPRTQLAQEAGIPTGRGILVDRLLRTAAPGIHALGDCAELVHEGQSHVLPYVMPLMAQARALAATLAGQPTPVTYPAMPVTVKTPACPTVVCPPPMQAEGRWQVETADDGCSALYTAPDGRLLGFALLGAATARKQALAREVPGLVG